MANLNLYLRQNFLTYYNAKARNLDVLDKVDINNKGTHI